MKIPSHYLPIMPYLILNDSNGFFEFSKAVFGAIPLIIQKGEKETIMHGEIKIGDAVVMFAQATENWAIKSAGMFLYVEDVDLVYDLALRENAISLMRPEKKDYGYTAGFEDPFGNHWWIVAGE